METPLSVAQITRDFSGARFFWRTEPFTPKKKPKIDCVWKHQTSNSRLRHSTSLGAAAPVTGAAADEYNLNVVDCNASVTVARPAVFHLSGVLPAAGGKRER